MGSAEGPLSERTDGGTRVAVIILTLDQRTATLGCLESFREIREPSHRILVWDNGSIDGTEAAVRARFPEVRVHRHPTNLGVASGRNAAAALATEEMAPEFLFFLDNDTRVAPDVLTALVEPFATEERLAATAPKLKLLRDPDRIDMAGGARIRYWLASTRGIGHGEIDRGQHDTPLECVTGGCVLVRTRIFHELGGFDPVFDPYGPEDLDFSLRAIRAGYRCLYIPRALIWHDPTQTFEGGKYTANLVRHKGRQWLLFLHRHAPPWKRLAFYAIGVPVLLVRMVIREGRRGNLGAVRGVLRAARDLLAR